MPLDNFQKPFNIEGLMMFGKKQTLKQQRHHSSTHALCEVFPLDFQGFRLFVNTRGGSNSLNVLMEASPCVRERGFDVVLFK